MRTRLLMAASLGLACATAAGPAGAQPADAETSAKLGACTAQTSDIQRLACFDQAFRAAPPATQNSGQNPAQNAALPDKLDLTMPDDQVGWAVRRARSPMDDSPTVAAVLVAKEAHIARLSVSKLPQKAALIVICRDHKTDMFVAYSDIVDGMGPIPVSYRIGDKPPVQETWPISQDFQSYGFWHTPRTVPFIQSLVEAGQFSVHADPGPMGVSEARFDLSGMREAVEPVRQACGW